MPVEHSTNFNGIGEFYSSGPLLKSVNELDQNGVIPETVIRVNGTKAVYVNYSLLQHDFPQLDNNVIEKTYPYLRRLKGAAKTAAIKRIIDDWLTFNTAFISQRQASQTNVNTKIEVGQEQVKAYRPPGYGRALVFSIEENNRLLKKNNCINQDCENRLIDVKGIGVAPNKEPIKHSHGNGVNSLEFALFEFIMQELLQRIFIHSKSAIQTIPVYGIIDLGFDEKDEFRDKPAALIARRAHRRPKDSGGLYTYGSTGQHVQLEIELLLRKYGITSSNANTTVHVWKKDDNLQICYGSQQIDFFSEEQLKEIEQVSHYKNKGGVLHFEGINIQQAREIELDPLVATLVDFQSYHVKKEFNNPILMLVSDLLLRWGGSIWPEHEDFVSPDPALQIPYDLISGTGTIYGYDLGKEKCKIDSLCYGLAEDFRANRITRKTILKRLETYLDSLTIHWNT